MPTGDIAPSKEPMDEIDLEFKDEDKAATGDDLNLLREIMKAA